ncbi:MAG TPA: phage major capsid protein [Puia sp.]|jgi:HK97 family phage major capsid protein
MKHNFIPFSGQPRNAMKFHSRRMAIRDFVCSAYKSDGDDAVQIREKLLEDIRKQLTDELQKRGLTTKEQVDAAILERMKSFEGIDLEGLRTHKADKEANVKELGELRAAMEVQGLELKALKDAAKSQLPDRKTIAGQIRAAIEKDKAAFDRFKRGESRSFGVDDKGNSSIVLEGIRAAITMTVAGSTGGGAFVPTPEIVPGLVDLARNQPFLENYSNTTTTTSPRIVWTEKYNPQGNATFLAEGGVKQLVSFEIRPMESYAKKVADKIKVSTEMVDDIDFIAGEIESELHYQVDIAVDNALLSGNGDASNGAVNLKGLTQYVGGYALTTISTTTPNDFDAIRAAIAQVISLNKTPNVVFYNTIDGANMDLIKDAQGRPLAMEYRDANGKLYRLATVETNQLPVGSFLVGDMTRFKVRNYQPFSVSYGWVNDDFEKNLFTVIGERRLHCYVAANDTGAFVFDTFANVKTAITAA